LFSNERKEVSVEGEALRKHFHAKLHEWGKGREGDESEILDTIKAALGDERATPPDKRWMVVEQWIERRAKEYSVSKENFVNILFDPQRSLKGVLSVIGEKGLKA
jgi:hypothetical protein